MDKHCGEERAQAAYERLESQNKDLSVREWIALLEEMISQCRAGLGAAREDQRRG